ncbi:hypothetical protein PLICRDRAFT_115850 [Plicaturopsis crispa FD-325 SS-3]|nr:hypothetical protein PLICRDRAFT_115850 [Plicaturopsis crispa FD-325 SS-3]
MNGLTALLVLNLVLSTLADVPVARHAVVSRFNPVRTASSNTTPLQVGNGNFAFGADITGLQTILPFNTLSSWGWKNDTLPPNKTWADVHAYEGVKWWNHDREVQYEFGGADGAVQQWLIANPNRVNLGRIGLVFWSPDGVRAANVTEADLSGARQELDLWTGKLTSTFQWQGHDVVVETAAHQTQDVVGVIVHSNATVGVFLDFPWCDGSAKFSAPFVGVWNATANHTTQLTAGRGNDTAQITHELVGASFLASVRGDAFTATRDDPSAHRYTFKPAANGSAFSLAVMYTSNDGHSAELVPSTNDVFASSAASWEEYWTESGFVDVLTGSTDTRAEELQRRIILSRYLMRVNEAGDYPPQESGLTNNGWVRTIYGKFHLEMYFWHSAHWALWNNWDILNRSTSVYKRFLPTSIARAQVQQDWGADSGARWGKMSDPSGRSAPGQINELLIWQQVHPLVFAEYEYRAFPTPATLRKWRDVVTATADWMAAFAWWNTSTSVYDLGPPMYVVSEDTSPNVTQNPAFELAYWRLGLDIAQRWVADLGERAPAQWGVVKEQLAPLPVTNGTYDVYEGIPADFWDTPTYTNDHPALVGLHGWLPLVPGVDGGIARATADRVAAAWNISNCWGWDFPMLAMSAARNENPEQALEWLLHPLFAFDDAGMPTSGVRAPTPYFPGAGGLLYAVAMMAGGWDGSEGAAPGFPTQGWNVRAEGISRAL